MEGEAPTERKSRKSVAFDDEQVVVDADGSVTMVNATEEPKDSAQSHTPPAEDAPPADDGGLDLSLMKKKKKKSKKVDDDAEAAPADDAAAAEDGGLDLTLKKKKKKPKAPKDDDFTKQLEKLELQEGAEETEEAPQEQEGDMNEGTGIWAHDETKTIGYTMLLSRFFSELTQRNPDHVMTGTKSYKIPPPQCMREGNRKTVFANIADICKRMKRTEEHVTAFKEWLSSLCTY